MKSITPTQQLWILIFFVTLVATINMDGWGVIESSEARYAEISREMARSGDWLHPTLLGIKHYHKPPITYWITAVGYQIFGITGFGARFFLVVSFAIQLFLVFKIAHELLGERKQALTAAMLFATLPIVLVSARGLTTDCFLNTLILGSLLAWMRWRKDGNTPSLYLAALLLGLGFLTKGPVVWIVPAVVMIGMGRHLQKRPWSVNHLVAALIFISVALSWFIALVVEQPKVLNYFLFRQTVERFAHAEVFQRSEPWWYYLAFGPLLAFPWIPVFFFKRLKTFTPMVKSILFFWVLGPLLFFSISSSKLVLYVLPLYAGLAIAMAFIIHSLSEKMLRTLARLLFIYFVLLCGALVVMPIVDKSIAVGPYLSAAPIFMIAVLLLVAWGLRKNAMGAIHFIPLAFTGFLLIYSTFLIGQNQLKFNASRPIAQWILQHNLSDRPILVYDKLLPSLSFELDRPIVSLHDGNKNLNREVQFEEDELWKEYYFMLEDELDQKRLRSLLSKPVLLVVKGQPKSASQWLLKDFQQQGTLGDWTVYY